MKAYRGNRGIDTFILNFDIIWRWMVSFRLRPFYPLEKTHTHWSGPRVSLGFSENRKICWSYRHSDPL